MHSITGIAKPVNSLTQPTERAKTPGEAQSKFANIFKDAIDNVNNLQKQSDLKTEALATGRIDDLHNVMITAQKASITLETTVQIRRKMIDAYNEVMRMQV